MNPTFTTTDHAAQRSGQSMALCVVGCLRAGSPAQPLAFRNRAVLPDTAINCAPAMSPVAASTLKEVAPQTIVLSDTLGLAQMQNIPQTGDAPGPEAAYPHQPATIREATEHRPGSEESVERRPMGLTERVGHSSSEALPKHEVPAQENTTDYEFLTAPAAFPGAREALPAFLKTHINTPAQEFGMPGPAGQSLILHMAVEKDGRMSHLTSRNRVSTPTAYNEEALRAANMFPDVASGKMNGAFVRSTIRIPVKIRFQ